MPLRQSLLSFKAGPLQTTLPTTETAPQKRAVLSRTLSGSSNDEDLDTIVVNLSQPRVQLPTPSESATDVSSISSQTLSLKEVTNGHAKRVRGTKNRHSQDCLLESVDATQQRSVSGETLVPSESQPSLLKSDAIEMDVLWNSISRHHSVESVSTMDDDDYQARLEKQAAKRAKMEENAKLRQAKRKEADNKATRRSARASLLEKASDMVSDLAVSVLGKRPREVYDKSVDRLEELKNKVRPRSMIEPLPASASSFEAPVSKKRRLSDSDLTNLEEETSKTVARKSFKKREKRWLNSGLYAGQSRQFDGRLSESKNKRKQGTKVDESKRGENTVLPLPMFAGERLLKQGRDFKLPFDVFSPLPAGQPKPDEWRKTNKNVFVGDAAQEWRKTRYEEHSTCMCRPDAGCDANCMNRFMYYECDDRNCNLTEEQCGNRSFEGLRHRAKKGGKYNVGVEVIKTVDRGYGVRSNRTFEPNQIIVEYTGEIINQEECESRMRTIYKNNECYYLMLFDQNMIIDATRGSIARFVNHSCEPNCRMEKWTVGGKPRMALFAGDRGVMTGEELTYDYNFDPYSQKNVQECRCGASNCRGVLGPRSKDERKPKSDEPSKVVAEGKLAGAKRKIAAVIDGKLIKKRKTVTVKATVYSSPKASKITKKIKKKPILRVSSISTKTATTTAIARRPSTLKRIINGAKERSTSKRAVSTSSIADGLISKKEKQPLSRSASVKAKASNLSKNVVRTVKGAQHGRDRSIRAVVDEE